MTYQMIRGRKNSVPNVKQHPNGWEYVPISVTLPKDTFDALENHMTLNGDMNRTKVIDCAIRASLGLGPRKSGENINKIITSPVEVRQELIVSTGEAIRNRDNKTKLIELQKRLASGQYDQFMKHDSTPDTGKPHIHTKSARKQVLARCHNICEICAQQPAFYTIHKTFKRTSRKNLTSIDELLGICVLCFKQKQREMSRLQKSNNTGLPS